MLFYESLLVQFLARSEWSASLWDCSYQLTQLHREDRTELDADESYNV